MYRKDFEAFGCTMLGSRCGQECEVTSNIAYLKSNTPQVPFCGKSSSLAHGVSVQLRTQLLLALPGKPEVCKQLVVILGPYLTPVKDLPLHRPMKWPRGSVEGF